MNFDRFRSKHALFARCQITLLRMADTSCRGVWLKKKKSSTKHKGRYVDRMKHKKYVTHNSHTSSIKKTRKYQ